MRTSPPILIAIALVGALLWPASACTTDDAGADTVDAGPSDAGQEGETTIAPLPIFTARAKASVTQGNAPLEVQFEGEVTGEVTAEEVNLSWVFGDGDGSAELSPQHTFVKSGTYSVRFTATYVSPDGRSRKSTDTLSIKVLGCADLTWGKVTMASPVDVAPGDTVSLQRAVLSNEGDRIATPFDVEVRLSADDALDEADAVLGSWSVESMDSGLLGDSTIDYAGKEFVVPSDFPEGNYYVFLVADAGGAINECSEDNNLAVSTNNITVDEAVAFKPDLTMQDVSFPEDLVVKQGQIISYSFAISNTGQGDAGQFKLGFWLSTDPVLDEDTDRVLFGPGDIGATMQQFAAGATLPFNKSYKIPDDLPDGDYWMIGKVDVQDQIAEESEDNNVAVSAQPFTMKHEVIQCLDLAFDELNVAPLSTYWGGTVQVSATISNPGTMPTPDGAEMRVYLSLQASLNPANATVLGTFPLEPIAPGETVTVDQVVGIPSGIPVQPHRIGVILDPDKDITECDEGNNAKIFPQEIGVTSSASVDVAVSNIQFHPTTVQAGDKVKLAFTVTNSGSTGATAFTAAVVLSEDSTISISEANNGTDHVVAQTVVSSVPAAGTEPQVVDVPIPLSLAHDVTTYTVGVILDLDKSLDSDQNASNNIGKAGTTLTVEGAQGGCFEDDYESNNTLGTAAPLTPGLHEGLGSCGNDDWYSVHVPVGHSLLVGMDSAPILSFEPVSSSLSLSLVDTQGIVIDESLNAGDHKDVHLFTAAEDRDVAIHVAPSAGARASYSLGVDVLPPVEGVDLLPADVTAQPASLYPGGLLSVRWSDVNLGDQSAGPHLVRVWASQDATLDTDGGDRVVYEGTVGEVPQATSVEQAVEAQLPTDLPGGTWRFLVETDADDDVLEVHEDNNVGVSDTIFVDPELVCEDDELEPNNDPTLATPVTWTDEGVVLESSRVVCPKLDDWYAVELQEGDALSAKATYKHDADKGSLAVELWDTTGTAMLLSEAAKDTVQVKLPWAWTAGTYFVRVRNQPVGGAEGPYIYNLALTRGPGDAADACHGDAFEDDNSFETAAPLGCGVQKATLCKGDVDVYRVELRAGDNLSVTLAHDTGALKMRLFTDPDGPSVASKTGNGTLSYAVTEDQMAFLRVEPKGTPASLTSYDYTLILDGVPGVDLTVDGVSLYADEVYQGDDALVSFEVVNACIDPAPASQASVWLSEDEALDDTDVPLSTLDVPAVTGKGSAALSDKVQIPLSTTPGPYFLLVDADTTGVVQESNEDNNASGVALTVAELCLPDAYEPNDLLSAAPPYAPEVAAPGAEGLSLCPYEIDWFSVAGHAGKALTVGIHFDPEQGDLDLRLYDPTYSVTVPVVSSATDAGDEVVTFPVGVDGPLLVRVNGFAGASAGYSLTISEE